MLATISYKYSVAFSGEQFQSVKQYSKQFENTWKPAELMSIILTSKIIHPLLFHRNFCRFRVSIIPTEQSSKLKCDTNTLGICHVYFNTVLAKIFGFENK